MVRAVDGEQSSCTQTLRTLNASHRSTIKFNSILRVGMRPLHSIAIGTGGQVWRCLGERHFLRPRKFCCFHKSTAGWPIGQLAGSVLHVSAICRLSTRPWIAGVHDPRNWRHSTDTVRVHPCIAAFERETDRTWYKPSFHKQVRCRTFGRHGVNTIDGLHAKEPLVAIASSTAGNDPKSMRDG